MDRARRVFGHPAWLAPILVVVFLAGAAIGEHAGDDQAAQTVTRRITSVSTSDEFVPAGTVTVTHTRRVKAPASSTDVVTATRTAGNVTVRYGRWYGKFKATDLTMTTSSAGAEILGQFENTRACANADVTLDATFYRGAAIIGTGSGAVPSAPEGSPVSLDIIGFFSGTPNSAVVAVTDVLCS
jgi:hypothetical protein